MRMKCGFAAIMALATPVFLCNGARAVERPARTYGMSCADFRQNPDGSWTPIRKVTIVGPNGPFSVEPGQVFRIQIEGTTNYGVKIAEILDDLCR